MKSKPNIPTSPGPNAKTTSSTEKPEEKDSRVASLQQEAIRILNEVDAILKARESKPKP